MQTIERRAETLGFYLLMSSCPPLSPDLLALFQLPETEACAGSALCTGLVAIWAQWELFSRALSTPPNPSLGKPGCSSSLGSEDKQTGSRITLWSKGSCPSVVSAASLPGACPSLPGAGGGQRAHCVDTQRSCEVWVLRTPGEGSRMEPSSAAVDGDRAEHGARSHGRHRPDPRAQ